MGAVADPNIFTKEEIRRLRRGEVVEVCGKRYRLCQRCEQAIRIDGWTGDIHVCA